MKIFRIKDHYQDTFDEYVLGPHEFGNKTGYVAWGEIPPGGEKTLDPGSGHEEIVLVLKGEVSVKNGGSVAGTGEAFYLAPGARVKLMAGPEGCTYVCAGAHVEHEGHAH